MSNHQPVFVSLRDMMFGNIGAVVKLIKEGRWDEASKFADIMTYNAVINDDDWW